MARKTVSRPQAFVVLLLFLYLNPLTLLTLDGPFFLLAIPTLTILLWIVVFWDRFRTLTARGNLAEIITGLLLIGIPLGRNLILGDRLGLTDMLVVYGGLSVALFGIRAFRAFSLPILGFFTIIISNQAEELFPILERLEYVFLDGWINLGIRPLGMEAEVFGGGVMVRTITNDFILQIEGPTTGIKGILPFGGILTLSAYQLRTSVVNRSKFLILGFVGLAVITMVRLWGIFLAISIFGLGWYNLSTYSYFSLSLVASWILLFSFYRSRWQLRKSLAP